MGHREPISEKEERRIVELLGLVQSGEITIAAIATRMGRPVNTICGIKRKHGIVFTNLHEIRALGFVQQARDKRRRERQS